jgi:hypothetical protein
MGGLADVDRPLTCEPATPLNQRIEARIRTTGVACKQVALFVVLLVTSLPQTADAYITTVYAVNSTGRSADQAFVDEVSRIAKAAWRAVCETPTGPKRCAEKYGYDVVVSVSADGCAVQIDDTKFQLTPSDEPRDHFIQKAFLECGPDGKLNFKASW